MNETGMSSRDWHKFNDHLKSLITKDYVTIERKGLEPKVLEHYAGFIVTSNHDAPLRIEIGDRCIVCFDVSSQYKDDKTYFRPLGRVLKHPDAPSVVMAYLLSLDLSDWSPQEIPFTKMKVEMMRDQLPNPVRFIINFIVNRDRVFKQSHTSLYQKYLEWCGENGEKPLIVKLLERNSQILVLKANKHGQVAEKGNGSIFLTAQKS